MTPESTISPLTELEAYDRFVDSSPQGVLYCHTWWLDAVAQNQYSILSVREGQEIKAAWPITFQEVNGKRVIAMPPLTQKLGVLLSPDDGKYAERLSREHALVEALIEQLPEQTSVNHQFHEHFTNWLPLYWNHFQQTTRYTYLAPEFGDADAQWNAARKSARNQIRGAQKNGLRVRETTDIEEVFRLYVLTMKRQGLAPAYTLEQLQCVESACLKHAGRLLLVAEDSQGRAHGGLFLVYDDQCAIYLLGGADPDLRQSGSQTILLWTAMQFAIGKSKRFDFEGSMIRGVERAIRDLGGVQAPYFRIWRDANYDQPPRRTTGLGPFTGRALRKLARIVDPD